MNECLACCREDEPRQATSVEVMTNAANLQTVGLSLETTSSLGSQPVQEAVSGGNISEEFDLDEAVQRHVKLPSEEDSKGEVAEQATTAFVSSERVTTMPSLSNPDILRVTSVRNVLCMGGSILKNSSGSKETYLLSKPRQWIDIFISHNWSVPRWKKFWALTLYVNMGQAVVMSYVGIAIGCVLNLLSIPPALRFAGETKRQWCMILGNCGFWGALLFGHDVPLMARLFCQRQVFLDKICIHQTDPSLKAAGINSLGAFLRHSSKMLVLFNVVYCKRLWTVYEIACYMYLHKRETLELLPVDIASVVLKTSGLFSGVHLLFRLIGHLEAMYELGGFLANMVVFGVGAILLTILAFILRKWALQQSELLDDLRSFQIAKASCAEESDRVVVSSNICAFARSMGLVKVSASDAEALQSFDKLVQERMPEMLRSAVGYVGFPYKYALVAGIAHDYYVFDAISSFENPAALEVLSWLAYDFVGRAVLIPWIFLVCAMMGKACRPRSSWGELFVKLGTGATSFLVTVLMTGLTYMGHFYSAKSVWFLLAYVASGALMTLVTIKLFAWSPGAAAPTTLAIIRRSSGGSNSAM